MYKQADLQIIPVCNYIDRVKSQTHVGWLMLPVVQSEGIWRAKNANLFLNIAIVTEVNFWQNFSVSCYRPLDLEGFE